MAESDLMASAQHFMVRQLFAYLADTNISKAGCKWLSKANWKQLNTIRLGKSEINQAAIKFLGKVVDI